MNLRCKKGDLAIVLVEDWAGYIVEVLDFAGTVKDQYGDTWEDAWLVSKRGEAMIGGRPVAIPDSWLLPIRPGDLKETEETEKEIESV